MQKYNIIIIATAIADYNNVITMSCYDHSISLNAQYDIAGTIIIIIIANLT